MGRMHREYEDGVLVREWPWTLTEELTLDARLFYLRLMKAAVGGAPPWPHTIEEWRQRWDVMAAVDEWLRMRGIDPATVTAREKIAASSGVEFGLVAAIFFYASGWQNTFENQLEQ